MIRFALLLLLSFVVSSQAVAAVKWNNSKSNKLCKSQPESGTQTKQDILGDGKWLDKKTKLSMSKITKNNLQNRLNFNSRNIDRTDILSFAEKAGRNSAKFSVKYSHKGHKLDWERWGEPGFAQRFQIMLKKKHDAKYGEEYWYSLSYFLEDRNLTPGGGHQLSLFDLKYRKDCSEVGVGINMSLRNSKFMLDFVTDQPPKKIKGEAGDGFDTPHYILEFDESAFEAPLYGRWVDIIMNVKWENENGHFRMWIDNELVVNYNKGPVAVGIGEQFSFKFGPYRNHMPKGRAWGDVELHYSDIGMAKTCEELVGNCEELNSAVVEKPIAKKIKAASICSQDRCNNLTETKSGNHLSFYSGAQQYDYNLLKLERFIGRGIWENYVRDFTTSDNRAKGLIETSTIIKHRSPVRALTYTFDLNVKKSTGIVAMVGGVTNDGQLNSTGKVISFNVQDKLAKKIENECGVDLIQIGEQKFPTFSIHEVKNAGFQRFDYEFSLLGNKTKCQLEIFDRFSIEFWYELLHLIGKSLRGTQENGNYAENAKLVANFGRLQENVKSAFKR
tara:strand:+ start:605 stop:2278 length:1674 start_codon:yes stop_codon:yes gene_type:complete